MDDYDRANLFFLLNSDPDSLKVWYNSVGSDDHDYAAELMSRYSLELDVKLRLLSVEEVDLTMPDMTLDAIWYLSKFRLGNRH